MTTSGSRRSALTISRSAPFGHSYSRWKPFARTLTSPGDRGPRRCRAVQFSGSGPIRRVRLPGNTLQIRGQAVCASLRGLPFEPCFNLEKKDERSGLQHELRLLRFPPPERSANVDGAGGGAAPLDAPCGTDRPDGCAARRDRRAGPEMTAQSGRPSSPAGAATTFRSLLGRALHQH